jgi:hypothetical protein
LQKTRSAKNAMAKQWDVEDGDQRCLRSIKGLGAAMSKGNQWIGFVRNMCVWSLLREFVSGALSLSVFKLSLVCNNKNLCWGKGLTKNVECDTLYLVCFLNETGGESPLSQKNLWRPFQLE